MNDFVGFSVAMVTDPANIEYKTLKRGRWLFLF